MFAVPVLPDYTKQFDRIIEILGARQTPQWVWLVVGWFLGIASTVVVGWIDRTRERYYLRRMLYREMPHNYCQLSLLRSSLMLPPEQRLISNDPRSPLQFGSFEHAKSKRDVFESLNEVKDVETVYELFQRCEILSSQTPPTVFDLNPALAAFERRIGTVFSNRILLAVSSRIDRTFIEQVILDREKEQKTA